jgi:hypothetical protein
VSRDERSDGIALHDDFSVSGAPRAPVGYHLSMVSEDIGCEICGRRRGRGRGRVCGTDGCIRIEPSKPLHLARCCPECRKAVRDALEHRQKSGGDETKPLSVNVVGPAKPLRFAFCGPCDPLPVAHGLSLAIETNVPERERTYAVHVRALLHVADDVATEVARLAFERMVHAREQGATPMGIRFMSALEESPGTCAVVFEGLAEREDGGDILTQCAAECGTEIAVSEVTKPTITPGT